MDCVPSRWVWLWVAVSISATWGCGSHVPERVPAPNIDPAGAAAKAMQLYDANHDGVLSLDELSKCPGIKSSIKRFVGSDGKVTAASITTELEKMKESKVGVMTLVAYVTLDGKKLDGATVQFDPEPFMAGSISPASGVTNSQGAASILIDPQDRNKRGVNPGVYKVRITKMANGKDAIPARYNKDTELGVEVANDNLDLSAQSNFDLKSP